MIYAKKLIPMLGLALSLCACTPVTTETNPPIDVSQSYGEMPATEAASQEQAQTTADLDETHTDDYCSFIYDSQKMSISDLSDSSVAGSYLSIEPKGGMPEGSITHLEVFGGEKLTIPKGYTEESWKEYAKELAGSFYEDKSNLNMSVSESNFSTENGISLSATVEVAASDDIPAMTAVISAINGTNKSLVMIATTYENDPVSIKPYLEIMSSAKVF